MSELLTQSLSLNITLLGPPGEELPGDDGMTGYFFQHYQHVIGEEVIYAVKNFFESGKMLRSVNHTVITLIPKTKSVVSMKDFILLVFSMLFSRLYLRSLPIDFNL